MGDIFDGIEKAEERKKAVYLQPGMYEDLEVLEAKTDKTRKDETFFAVEFLVHKSAGEKANPPGSKATLMTMKKWDGFLTDVREWVGAIYGVPFAEVNGDAVRLVCTKANPAKGAHVKIEAWSKTTKKNEVAFTQTRWEHISRPEDLKARVAAAKAELAQKKAA